MNVRTELIGASKALRDLDGLDKKVRNQINRKATRAGGAIFLNALRGNVPKRNGYLKRSLTQKVKTYRRNGTVVSIIGQNKKYTRTARKLTRRTMSGGISGQGFAVPLHFVEYDTKPKRITPSTAKALRLAASKIDQSGKWGAVFRRAVSHPGTRGQSPVQRTERGTRAQVEAAVRQKIAAELAAL